MDEILASIRRIIESGEDRNTAEAKSADRSEKADVAEAVPASGDDEVEPSGDARGQFDVHYLPSALGVVPPRETAGGTGAEAPTEGDEAPAVIRVESRDRWGGDDVATDPTGYRVEKTEYRGEAEQAPLGSIEAVAAEPLHHPGNENAVRDDEAVAAAPADFAFEFDDEQFEADLRNGGWSESEQPDPSAADAETRVPRPANSQTRHVPESVIDGASALLSAEAGNQVAVAFGDLARAIREGHMRSMEEMAREMLRPMLQEWLDDNLPRIVERLVREEIERVARGARF